MSQNNLILHLILIAVVNSLVYHALERGVRLNQGDQIISTLGLYKIVFISNDCSLNFYQFNTVSQNYFPLNQKYHGNHQGKCLFIETQQNRILTDTGQIFLQLTNNVTLKSYLIVDDLGTIRFIGIKRAQGQGMVASDFQQIKFASNSNSNQYISMLTDFKTIKQQFSSPVTNNNNWIFFFTNSQLIISKATTIQNFKLPAATFSQSGIFDNQNQTFPYVNFQGINYHSVCGQNNQIFGPFVLEIDSNWPVVTIRDQGGHALFQFGVGSTNSYNPCPDGLFLLGKDCSPTCPPSYYHFIQQSKGRCLLNCPSGSIYNNISKTCQCSNSFQITPLFNCVNTTQYIFGCYCSGSYLDISTQRCTSNCSSGSVGYGGLCVYCGLGCTDCVPNNTQSSLISCTSCSSDYTLKGGKCVQTCSDTNCLRCIGGICIACKPFTALLNNFCIPSCPTATVMTMMNNLTTICDQNISNLQSSSTKCPFSCLSCSVSSVCLVCKLGYILLVSPPKTICTKQSLLFSCKSPLYSSHGNICYSHQSSVLVSLSKCKTTVLNCFLCLYQSSTTCLSCAIGFHLQQNKCVTSCSKGYYNIDNVCLKGKQNCKMNSYKSGLLNSQFNINTVLQNQVYLQLINQHQQLSEPYGYGLWAEKEYLFSNNVANVKADIFSSEDFCYQCNQGFGLSRDGKSCLPCPNGCLLCYNAYDNSCIASTPEELALYSNKQSVSACKGFITQTQQCIQSCPSDTIPLLNSTYTKLQCVKISSLQSGQVNYLKIDGCTFQINSQKYIHKFIFSEPLKHRNMTVARLLQSNANIGVDGTSVSIQNNQPSAVLNLSGVVQNYQSINNNYPASTVYGVSVDTSFRSFINQDYVWIGYLFSIAILCAHFVFVGNNYMYKMDNIIIFGQSIFYFLFVRLLSSNPVAQYYYGWGWLHISFYPNYFSSSLDSAASSAAPYALFNIDANFIRNAGSALSLFITFVIIWLLASLICYLVDVQFKKYEIWFFQISKNAFCAAFQLLSFAIFYWAVAYSHYDEDGDSTDTFAGLTAFCIIAILGYTLVRLYFDKIGGTYMIKRIVYASILASSYQKLSYFAILAVFQVIFTICRFLLEKPHSKRLKIYLCLQQIGTILGMIVLYFATQVIVVAFLVSLIIYIWSVSLAVDLVDAYLITKNMVRSTSWFPCLSDPDDFENEGSSKEQIQDGVNTNRPFNSNVDK